MIVDDTASGSLLTTACSLASRSFVVQQSSFGARVAVLLAPLSSVLPAVRLSVSALPPSLPSVHPHDAYTGIHQAATQHWHARQQIHLRHLLQCRDAPQVCCSSVSRQRAPRVIHRYSTRTCSFHITFMESLHRRVSDWGDDKILSDIFLELVCEAASFPRPMAYCSTPLQASCPLLTLLASRSFLSSRTPLDAYASYRTSSSTHSTV